MSEKTILLVEDNPDDEALTLRALRHSKLSRMPTLVLLDWGCTGCC